MPGVRKGRMCLSKRFCGDDDEDDDEAEVAHSAAPPMPEFVASADDLQYCSPSRAAAEGEGSPVVAVNVSDEGRQRTGTRKLAD